MPNDRMSQAYVMNVAMGDLTIQFCWEIFWRNTGGCCDDEKFLQWLEKAAPFAFEEEQKQRMKDSLELKAASYLMQLVRENELQNLRE